MECVTPKLPKRSRKRKRKKRAKAKRLDRGKNFEVINAKRQRQIANKHVYNRCRGKIVTGTMEANAFWENYAAAHEWQRRHSVSWWKTRCSALEHENNILKEKIQSMVQNNHSKSHFLPQNQNYRSDKVKENEKDEEEDEEVEEEEEEENGALEFQVNDDMIKFLEQSIRHKMELKQRKESEEKMFENKEKEGEKLAQLEGGASWVRKRTKGGQLLYGEASSRILAMETALQATSDRHVDKAKPQYWPNIPLNL